MSANFDNSTFWNHFSWTQAREFLAVDTTMQEKVVAAARDRTIQVFGNGIKLFFPGSVFPAISITGDQCALQCLHCDKKYLKHMKQAPSPEILLDICKRLDARGAVGCLISGGCNETGSVPLEPFLDVIEKIKRETRLVLNLHTGLLTPEVAARLGEIGVDVVSFDVNGSADTVREIYRLNRSIEDYKESLDLLTRHHVHFVPHVCIGLHFGHLKGEVNALELIAKYAPQTIVFIILIPPTEGPHKKLFVLPDAGDISKVFCIARAAFPRTELFLGCMRPGGRVKSTIERRALAAGATSIVIPTQNIQEYLESMKIPTFRYKSCCAIPPALYKNALNK